jgi:hypothetical protein
LEVVTTAFEKTGVSGYVWIAGKVSDLLRVPGIGQQDQQNLKAQLQQALERITVKLSSLLSSASPTDVQDSKSL